MREQERAELHRVIWGMANKLRGSVDGWDFKAYVLGFLFYRYLSEDFVNQIHKEEHKHNPDFSYPDMTDEEVDEAEDFKSSIVNDKGYFIYPSQLFCNVAKSIKNSKEAKETLNETLAEVFKSIEASTFGTPSEDKFKGLFDDVELNSNKLGGTVLERNKRLEDIIASISTLNLGVNNNSIDAFGDAYEYLMQMYASSAGKSGGEYYTPQEVSELLAKITIGDRTTINKVYDPAAGSGGLLLQFAKILGGKNITDGFYGQEINITTYNLCRINMLLHGVPYEKMHIRHGDTLTSPKHDNEKPFQAIVANPPYSISWEGKDDPILVDDPRYAPAGVLAPKSKADLAFVMHILSYLANDGTAAIVSFPGVLYRSGAEQKIRQYLVDNNYVDAIINLPEDLFFGTSIATSIIVVKKSRQDDKVLFVDASKECVKVTNSNKLTDENIESIINIYKTKEEKDHISRLVGKDEIAENNYNLSVSTYVEPEDTREKVDIDKLNKEIKCIVGNVDRLRGEIDKIIEEIEGSEEEDE